MLALLALLTTAQASDLLLPPFSLEPDSEPAGAEILYTEVLEALRKRDIEFLDADDIAEFAGNEGLNCAARPECPGTLWEKVKGKLAMTATVGLKGETLTVVVQFHRPGKEVAVEFVQDELPASKAGELAMDLALITQDLLNNEDDDTAPMVGVPVPVGAPGEDPLGDIPEGGTLPTAPLDEDAPLPEVVSPDPAPAEAPVEEAPVAAPSTPADTTATARTLGVPKGAFERYTTSGLSPNEWAAEARVRSRRFFLELHAGVTMGDVKRRYATRAAIQQEGETRFSPLAYYERDAMISGGAFSTGVALGYTPAWWLEGGVLLGLEFPRKELITGWEAYGPDDDYADRSPSSSDQVVYQPATALTLLLEPRLRLLLSPTGQVKPYLLGGYTVRFYDGYDTPDLQQVAFPNRSGLVSSGPLAGVGLSFDPRHKASGFIEGALIRFLTPDVVDEGRDGMSQIPKPVDGTGYGVAVRAGVTTRF